MKTRIRVVLKRTVLWGSVVAVALVAALGVTVAIQARRNHERFANQAAETLRGIVGERAVRNLEYAIYTTAHRYHRWRMPAPGRVDASVAAALERPLKAGARSSDGPPADLQPLIVQPALEQEGRWRPLRGKFAGLWLTQIRPAPHETDQVVDLVAIDLSKYRIHYVPGTLVTKNSSLSRIPSPDSEAVVAVFNGGFRGRRAETGQRKSGIVYHPLRPDQGSIILDGETATICAWTKDHDARYSSADVRQNLPLLLRDGLPGRELLDWLKARNLDFGTVRTGLGINADQRWMVFAGGGPYLDPLELARALRLAGCTEAVLLDQNLGNVFFDLVKKSKNRMKMTSFSPMLHLIHDRKLLKGSDRDFFYVTPATGS